jgi:hypothetical protein
MGRPFFQYLIFILDLQLFSASLYLSNSLFPFYVLISFFLSAMTFFCCLRSLCSGVMRLQWDIYGINCGLFTLINSLGSLFCQMKTNAKVVYFRNHRLLLIPDKSLYAYFCVSDQFLAIDQNWNTSEECIFPLKFRNKFVKQLREFFLLFPQIA